MENNASALTVYQHTIQGLRFIGAAMVLGVAGCVAGAGFVGGGGDVATEEFPETLPRPAVYLAPGDVIETKFLYWPELDQEQEIRPDGKISLQLLGHITVAGLTVERLDNLLVELYADRINEPAITTIVRSFGNRRAYIGGEVTAPGFVDLTDQMTALEAVMTAGGFDKASAKISDVVVIRHMDGRRYAKLLDFNRPVDDPDSNLLLAPRDIVYVPRTRIDQVNQWVDQYISRLIPSPVWTYAIYSD